MLHSLFIYSIMTNPESTVAFWTDTITRHKLELGCALLATIFYHIFGKYSQAKLEATIKTDTLSTSQPLRKRLRPNDQFISERRLSEKVVRLPENVINSQNSLLDEVRHLYDPSCKIERVPHLFKQLKLKKVPQIRSPLIGKNNGRNSGEGFLPEEAFVYRGEFILSKNTYSNEEELSNPVAWLQAGPRKYIYFEPEKVKAAILTCGGLCPGLNVVIREIYNTLSLVYHAPEVWGINFGLKGSFSGEQYWVRLHEKLVREIQYNGGTMLGSSRGGFFLDKIVTSLIERGINQLYIIGGDGTHRALAAISSKLIQMKQEISLVGIPKTIDNDIPIIDKSFGFQTAVSESLRAIRSAYVQSRGVQYGIGLVRLMGRDAGFIAMEATNGSRDVDVCLVPQFQFDLYGPLGVLEYIYQQLLIKSHLVIVVAEGAGNGVRDLSQLKQGVEKDQSGNIKLPDIGKFLQIQIVEYCKKKALNATLKYIDPAYMIRSVSANAYDRKMCAHLAMSAVHGAMAGYTAFTVGHINQHVAMIPISSLKQSSKITKDNKAWQRMLAYTMQPTFLNETIQ